MYIALEAGIGSGALFSAMIYQNKTENFKWAFLISTLLAAVGLFLLIFWRKQNSHQVTEHDYVLEE
jgi:predicted MFS family arabinose efflux permease